MKNQSKNLSELLKILKEKADGTLEGGFGSIKGGFEKSYKMNAFACQNTGTCSADNGLQCTNNTCTTGTNEDSCTNQTSCFGSTNIRLCTNSVSCFY